MFETQKFVDMTSLGKNGLNIRTNASRPQKGQDQVSGGVSVLCWLAAPVTMFYGNLRNLVMRSKAKEKYRGMFEIQKSGDKTSSGEIGLDIRTHASPKRLR